MTSKQSVHSAYRAIRIGLNLRIDANTALQYVSHGQFSTDQSRAETGRLQSSPIQSELMVAQFYKPWQLVPQQEERIKNQIAEAESLIEREVTEFQTRQPKEKSQGKTETEDTNGASKETVGEPATESPSVPSLALVDTTNLPVQAPQSESKTEKLALEEHNGEVVVENEEDTVIY